MTVEQARIPDTADDVLLAAAYAGDEAAFEQFFERHYSSVYRVALRVVGNAEDAEEVTIDAFVRLHQRRIEIGASEQILAWLYRTTTNAAFNKIRSRKRRLGWLRRAAFRRPLERREAEDPALMFEREEAADTVRRALKSLPERQRTALTLRAAGLSYQEVAAAIDVKPSSVGTIIARAEARLRDAYQQEGGQ